MSIFLERLVDIKFKDYYFVVYQEDVINNQWRHCVDNDDAIKHVIKEWLSTIYVYIFVWHPGARWENQDAEVLSTLHSSVT